MLAGKKKSKAASSRYANEGHLDKEQGAAVQQYILQSLCFAPKGASFKNTRGAGVTTPALVSRALILAYLVIGIFCGRMTGVVHAIPRKQALLGPHVV